MSDLTVSDLTEVTPTGKGVFDVLMQATKAHLEQEFSKNRIKGTEYSQVYLGSLQAVLNSSLEFLLQRDKTNLEKQLMEQQILVAKAAVDKAVAEVELMREQVNIAKVNLDIARLSLEKIPAEIAHLQAQTRLIDQQQLNAVVEHEVLENQVCKLKAEYDLILANTEKAGAERDVLNQKVVTERAQVSAVGVDPDSVIGKQKALYQAQTNGFARDAEQKAAKLMADTWNVRRTTDEGTVADGTNMLSDAAVGRAINKMLQGVGA